MTMNNDVMKRDYNDGDEIDSDEAFSNSNSNSNLSIVSEMEAERETATESEQWSLRVRLISAVDLPPSVVPSVPLCPLFKFGLVTDSEIESEGETDTSRDTYADTDNETDKYADSENNGTDKCKRVKCSSTKILSAKDNGMMEWHEEYRWDNIAAPLCTTLTVDLSARQVFTAVPDSTTATNAYIHTHANASAYTNLNSKSNNSNSTTSPGRIRSSVDYDSVYEQALHQHRTNNSISPLHHSNSIKTNDTSALGSESQSDSASQSTSAITFNDSTNINTSSTTACNTDDSNLHTTAPTRFLNLFRKGAKQTQTYDHRRRHTATSISDKFISHLRQLPKSNQHNSTNATISPALSTNSLSHMDKYSLHEHEIQHVTAAAAVAKYIMDEANSTTKNHSHTDTDPDMHDSYFQSTTNTNGNGNGNNSHTDHTKAISSSNSPFSQTYIDQSGDLHLGTLHIPLSDLPLEEEYPRVEKWYQVDTIHHQKTTHIPTPPTTANINNTNYSNNTINTMVSNISNEDFITTNTHNKKLISPHRSPSVLLEISFCNTLLMNDFEDDPYTSTSHNTSTYNPDFHQLNMDIIAQHSHDHITHQHISWNRDITSSSDPPRNPHSVDNNPVEHHSRRYSAEEQERIAQNGPFLEPGIIDYLCVVGAKHIDKFIYHNHDFDDYATSINTGNNNRGWVENEPECCVLEQYPPNDEVHAENGRSCILPNKVEWFCFPEGCKLWRGSEAPTHLDMNLKRFSASSAPSMASSIAAIAAFDACLNCTTSFLWWVISSNSDKYGSSNVKTYGAVIRFYVPLPLPPTTEGDNDEFGSGENDRQIWCPLGICMTSSLPIIGVMEALLLRLCEKLAFRSSSLDTASAMSRIKLDIANLITNYPRPIPGVLQCSLPFLTADNDRFIISLPPQDGLPSLPHGASVVSVCRLLGAEGLTALLAAVLTECKILIHSADVSNLAMVAEVVTALIYPFQWQLPYIPALPLSMLEFLEAPLSYFVGTPSCNMQYIDNNVLVDVVVIDLDNGFSSSDYFDGRRSMKSTKIPNPLPSTVSSNISKAVFRLLREEEEAEHDLGSSSFTENRHLPRLDGESLAEREFRITVAQQISGLVRGYQECLFFVSASQPVFNRDRFLRQAPALFEERKNALSSTAGGQHRPSFASVEFSSDTISGNYLQRIMSPRSKRFLTVLVNTQHFHVLLEKLGSEEVSFFHQIMESFDLQSNSHGEKNTVIAQYEELTKRLEQSLELMEQRVPTYHIQRDGEKGKGEQYDHIDDIIGDYDDISSFDVDDSAYFSSFTFKLLNSVQMEKVNLSLTKSHEYEDYDKVVAYNISWRYSGLFDIPMKSMYIHVGPIDASIQRNQSTFFFHRWPMIQLRDAIGERKFRAWKLEQEKLIMLKGDSMSHNGNRDELDETPSCDLLSLVSAASVDVGDDANVQLYGNYADLMRNDELESSSVDVTSKDRNAVRVCLEKACEVARKENHGNRDNVLMIEAKVIKDAEVALRNSSAQRFLVSILSQRSRLEIEERLNQTSMDFHGTGLNHKQTSEVSSFRLDPILFECLVRLCYAMLEANVQEQDYESAYRLLTHSTGFSVSYPPLSNGEDKMQSAAIMFLTKRIRLHPIFRDYKFWLRVLLIHMKDRQRDRSLTSGLSSAIDPDENVETDEYEAAVSTLYEMLGYGMQSDDLAKFASSIAENKLFSMEKEQKLLMLARRLVLKCDDVAESEINMTLISVRDGEDDEIPSIDEDDSKHCGTLTMERNMVWEEIAWYHPVTVSTGWIENQDTDQRSLVNTTPVNAQGYSGKSPVTALTSFGGSVVASGALDGSVFVAYTCNFGSNKSKSSSNSTRVNGIRLQWGEKDSLSPGGEKGFGVGAISSLVSSKGANFENVLPQIPDNADSFLSTMKGCKLIAGTTSGDLRVWSLPDVCSVGLEDIENDLDSSQFEARTAQTNGYTSSYASKGVLKDGDSSRSERLIKGRALIGHRGGVTCLNIPSQIYRPDQLFSAGNDGLIKLWSLKHLKHGKAVPAGSKARNLFSGRENVNKNTQVGIEPDETFSGHGGRILCLETVWHGDRLVSGGADRSLKLWDLANSGGKCLQTMEGHTSWVVKAKFWGRNTIISSSTDRCIGLWDARTGTSPLFVLRYHQSSVSDILIDSRRSYTMVSAGGDGTIATWDFRKLVPRISVEDHHSYSSKKYLTQVVREPVSTMSHRSEISSLRTTGSGPTFLAHGLKDRRIMSVSIDNIVKDWDINSGSMLDEHKLLHSNAVSSFLTYSHVDNLFAGNEIRGVDCYTLLGGFITSSFDGSVRLRHQISKPLYRNSI